MASLITYVRRETEVIDRPKRISLRLTLIATSLLLELAAYALVPGVIVAIWWSEPGYKFDNFLFSIELWLISIMYRAVSIHIYASWRLKLFLIRRRVGALVISLADLALAVLWAGVLSLFFPPARMLFSDAIFWVPIFSGIFLGSLLFSSLCRKQVFSLNEASVGH